jgi:pyrroloquinoline quinone biosynthesis protein D
MPAADAIPSLAPGVRFRRLKDGRGVLLIPEGVVNLNSTASAVVELVDGRRTSADICAALSHEYAAAAPTIAADVSELLERLRMAGWVFFSSAARL